jgi:hypothetical protein
MTANRTPFGPTEHGGWTDLRLHLPSIEGKTKAVSGAQQVDITIITAQFGSENAPHGLRERVLRCIHGQTGARSVAEWHTVNPDHGRCH